MSMEDKRRQYSYCVIVDLDYTLVSIDTTATLAWVVCPHITKLILNILTLTFLRFVVPLLNRALDRDVYKLLVLKLCLRACNDSLGRAVLEVYHRALKTLNKDLLKAIWRLNTFKILLTASVDIVAKRFRNLGFGLMISSKIECREGRLYNLVDLYSKKHVIVKRLLKYCDRIYIIEDSPEPQYEELENTRVFRVIYHE